MTRADFYIVDNPAVPYRFVCQLADKVINEGYDMYIHAASREEAATIDDLLWTFRDVSFLPHAVIDSADGVKDCPVVIGWEGEAPLARRVLINLSGAVPDNPDAYERIIEVVASEPEGRRQARLRYKDYRARGLELHSHNIGSGHA
jgi:DNA polymerase-3 subunit chi